LANDSLEVLVFRRFFRNDVCIVTTIETRRFNGERLYERLRELRDTTDAEGNNGRTIRSIRTIASIDTTGIEIIRPSRVNEWICRNGARIAGTRP